MRTLKIIAVVLIAAGLFSTETFAQRGRGGGGRGGGGFSGGNFGGGQARGGGNFGGGNFGGGQARSGGFGGGDFGGGQARGGGEFGGMSSSFNRSPSMSRPSNSQARSFNQGDFQGGQGGFSNRDVSSGAMSGRQAFDSPQSYQRPNQQSLGNFLNMPQTSGASSFNSGASTRTAAAQQPADGGTKSYTTNRGGTITVGGASGSGVTGSGATVGGAVGGIKVDTAGGQTFGKVGGVAGATDGTNSEIRGGSATGISDGQGNAAVNVRGGYANSSGYRQGGSITAAKNQYGYTSVNARGGYGYGNGTGRIGSVTAVRGPAGNVISAGHGASFVNGQFVGGQTWGAVNGAYTHWNCFGPGWVTNYPSYWWPGKWAVATTAWATATYAMAGGYCGCSSEGVYYDYGENVTYEDGTVYQDGQPVASQDEYYNQAEQIAVSGKETTSEDWMPLGVFALVDDGQTKTDKVAQLALNKEGVIRGNFHDILADTVTPITGAVDKKTQRVALKLQGNDKLLVETGLYNLTNDEVPILIHFGADRQENRKMVRLDKPPTDQAATN